MSQRTIPGVYVRRLSVDISDITRHRRFINYMKMYYRRHRSSLMFSPEIHMILDSVNSLSFIPSFFLAYSLCRINELSQITIPIIKSLTPITIKSSKSAHIRQIPPLVPYKIKALQGVPDNVDIMVISYDSLKNSIAGARDRCHIHIPGSALDCTHIFRHLQASFLFSMGHSLPDISDKLGHLNNKTTLTYIHEKE